MRSLTRWSVVCAISGHLLHKNHAYHKWHKSTVLRTLGLGRQSRRIHDLSLPAQRAVPPAQQSRSRADAPPRRFIGPATHSLRLRALVGFRLRVRPEPTPDYEPHQWRSRTKLLERALRRLEMGKVHSPRRAPAVLCRIGEALQGDQRKPGELVRRRGDANASGAAALLTPSRGLGGQRNWRNR